MLPYVISPISPALKGILNNRNLWGSSSILLNCFRQTRTCTGQKNHLSSAGLEVFAVFIDAICVINVPYFKSPEGKPSVSVRTDKYLTVQAIFSLGGGTCTMQDQFGTELCSAAVKGEQLWWASLHVAQWYPMHQKIILSLVIIFLAHLGLLGKTAGPGDPDCMVCMTCISKGLCVSFVPSDTLCILAQFMGSYFPSPFQVQDLVGSL